jgi:hypothetical protein
MYSLQILNLKSIVHNIACYQQLNLRFRADRNGVYLGYRKMPLELISSDIIHRSESSVQLLKFTHDDLYAR